MHAIDFTSASMHARFQDALLTADQLDTLGYSASSISRMCRRGVIERVQPNVYAVKGSPLTWRQSLRACQLSAPYLVVGGRAAMAMWGVECVPRVLEFVTPRPHWPRLFGAPVVHRTRDLLPADYTTVDG